MAHSETLIGATGEIGLLDRRNAAIVVPAIRGAATAFFPVIVEPAR